MEERNKKMLDTLEEEVLSTIYDYIDINVNDEPVSSKDYHFVTNIHKLFGNQRLLIDNEYYDNCVKAVQDLPQEKINEYSKYCMNINIIGFDKKNKKIILFDKASQKILLYLHYND